MKKKDSLGFTLIELMIVVAIIGILASIALPAYSNYVIQARILEGIGLVGPAKLEIATSVSTEQSLSLMAGQWNTQSGATSKYVDSITIDKTSGVILIDFNSDTIGLRSDADQLTLTPSVMLNTGTSIPLSEGLATGKINQIAWACSSSKHTRATSRGLIATIPDRPLPEKSAPKACR